jgi:transcriptional regulator with XRE-family HTH domain
MKRESLARKLQLLRAERGLTLVQAAALTGVTRGTLSELESGKRVAYMPTLSKIAEGYGVNVRELLLEEPVLAGKAEAPQESGLADALTEKIVEIQGWYRSREQGLELLCERWEQKLVALGENLGRESLDEMSLVGTYVTDYFVQAAVDEIAEISVVLQSSAAPGRPNTATIDSAAIEAASKSSIMKPALERWVRLGNEIYRRGAEKFGEDVARGAIRIGQPVDELAVRRAERLRRAAAS